ISQLSPRRVARRGLPVRGLLTALGVAHPEHHLDRREQRRAGAGGPPACPAGGVAPLRRIAYPWGWYSLLRVTPERDVAVRGGRQQRDPDIRHQRGDRDPRPRVP